MPGNVLVMDVNLCGFVVITFRKNHSFLSMPLNSLSVAVLKYVKEC